MEEINRQWFGSMTLENMPKVVEVICSMLDGKKYTFASSVGGRRMDVRTDQSIDHEKATSGDAFSIWYQEATPPQYGGFHVCDTYGSWGASTNEKEQPYISFEHHQIRIEQKNGFGEKIEWVIALQDKHNL